MTNDYKRHGTTTLSAAPNVVDTLPRTRSGCTIVGQHAAGHCHQEFPKFLDRINRTNPSGSPIHAILDNYNTHKHANVQTWLAKRPR